MTKLLPFALAFALLSGCGSTGGARRVSMEGDDEIMGTGIESADVEAMEQFAVRILAVPELTGPKVENPPTIAIHPVENDTDQDFDGELFVRRIRAALIKRARGRVQFVVRNRNEAVIERERVAKREGEYTANKQEMKSGADFILTGIAASLSKATREANSRAIWIDFQIVDAETGRIVWEDTLKTKKVGNNSVIYR